MARGPFPKVREAREALAARAVDIWERYEAMIAQAVAAGDYETANDAFQFLLSHMPPDEDGTRMIEHDVDRVKESGQKALPTINIGFALGGVARPALEATAIDVKAETEDE